MAPGGGAAADGSSGAQTESVAEHPAIVRLGIAPVPGHRSPIVLLQRFRGTLDHWDPGFVDPLAGRHRVITFDTPGAGGSSGSPKASISAMAADAAAVIAARSNSERSTGSVGRWVGW